MSTPHIPASVTIVIFEGIASVTVDGEDHDVYMTIQTESVGYTIRWYGSFTWMGEDPNKYPDPGLRRATLSDGRVCNISIPYPPVNGKVEFLGHNLPPGFCGLPGEDELAAYSAQVIRGQGSWVKRLPSRIFGLSSLAFLGTSFWFTENSLGLAGTAFCLMVAAIAFIPRGRDE